MPPPPPKGTELSGIAEQLDLGAKLPAVLRQFNGQWVEYGVFEQAFANAHPTDWEFLVGRYGHTAVTPKQYTVSAFLAATLGSLYRAGVVAYELGPATGRWKYNEKISWWALPPAPEWPGGVSWEGSGATVAYVPGQTELGS